MKGILLISLILLGGCESLIPLERLEEQALLTGDWSAVEQRERIIAKRKARSHSRCPAGSIAYCEAGISGERCNCINADVVRSFLGN